MYNSGDAAEQVVRISLEGTEVALKLTGSAAKNIAVMLYAVWKNRDKNKTKGHQRLSAMLKSGKELKVFTVSEEHLKQFALEAKRYGVVYCALRGKERSADGMVDIMVRAEDASKINRIVERFKLATVDTVSIKRDIEQSKADKTASSAPEQEKPDKAADDRLLDDLLGAPVQKEEHASPNPAAAKTEKSRPSAPTSEKQSRTAEGTAKSPEERPSVREELREIRESRQKEAAEPGISELTPAKEPKKQPTTTHKQPSRKKQKKAKERCPMSNFDDIFESTPQTDEFDKEAWAAKKKAERDEVYALADATAEAVCTDGGKFREYLDVQAAFRNYSATNALLILATKPDARRLGDKDFWRDQGVYIKRQEFSRPIKIVESNGEYTRDDGSIGVSYNIKRVYDISQTTARTRAPQAVSHDARALLNALIYKRPAPVQSVDELPNGMDAVYDREQNAVFVRRGLSANDLFCGLSKALAQAELARTGEEYTEENAGFKAHCVSYILGKEFGVEVSGYAFEAPADFLRTDDPQTIRAELTDIRDTAYDIFARMMRSLEQSKAPRQSEQER